MDALHNVSRNPSGPSTSGKIPEIFVVAAQPFADPCGAAYLDAGSFFYGHVAHAHHADGNHSGSEPCDTFCTPFRVLPVLCRPCIPEMRSDLQTFRLITRELWRVAIGRPTVHRPAHGVSCCHRHELWAGLAWPPMIVPRLVQPKPQPLHTFSFCSCLQCVCALSMHRILLRFRMPDACPCAASLLLFGSGSSFVFSVFQYGIVDECVRPAGVD